MALTSPLPERSDGCDGCGARDGHADDETQTHAYGGERPTLYDLPVVRRDVNNGDATEGAATAAERGDEMDEGHSDGHSEGLDIARMRTAVLVRPEVQATVTWQLLTFADRHEQEARRFTRQANDVLADVEDMRATLGRLIARADVIWQVEARWRTAEQRDQLDYLHAQMLRLEAEIARWRTHVIALRQEAKLEEARAIVCRRAAASGDRY